MVVAVPRPLRPNDGLALRKLYPDASYRTEVVCLDAHDGAGLQLVGWTLPHDFPTDAELDAALAEVQWDAVRAVRKPLLNHSDEIAIRCFEAGIPFPNNWRLYVLALRNVTSQADPLNITWPVKPPTPAGV